MRLLLPSRSRIADNTAFVFGSGLRSYPVVSLMQQDIIIEIKSLDMDGRGVGHLQNEDGTQGKVIFVEGALPGDRKSVV